MRAGLQVVIGAGRLGALPVVPGWFPSFPNAVLDPCRPLGDHGVHILARWPRPWLSLPQRCTASCRVGVEAGVSLRSSCEVTAGQRALMPARCTGRVQCGGASVPGNNDAVLPRIQAEF